MGDLEEVVGNVSSKTLEILPQPMMRPRDLHAKTRHLHARVGDLHVNSDSSRPSQLLAQRLPPDLHAAKMNVHGGFSNISKHTLLGPAYLKNTSVINDL